MYNSHRGMAPGPQHGQRLAELLDQVRQEFDAQAGRSNEHEHQVHGQIQEMELVRNKIYALEQTHNAMKAKYEDEIARLRHELEQRGGPSQGSGGGPSQPPPPAIGHGPANLFQGIMAGSASQGGPGLAPPQQDQQGQPGMPGQMHAHQGPTFQPQGPPQHPFQYAQPQAQPQAALNGYAQPHQTASPGPGRLAVIRDSTMPATPQQRQPLPSTSSPYTARPTPPPQPQQQQARPPHHLHHQVNGIGYSPEEMDSIGNTLSEYDPEKLPPAYKRIGEDWHAIFNPRVSRKLDVDLLHTLPHESVVCCVRFSHDGRFVATGCNKSAQIFDVQTGAEVCKLIDATADMVNTDLYIRSVCFSPDGRHLATGAEDKLIRVWNIETTQIVRRYNGHEMDIYSLDFSADSRHIVSGSGDRTVRVWNFDSQEQILTMSITDGVTTVAFSPDGHSIAAGSLDRTVRVWDIETGTSRENTEDHENQHKDSVYSVAFNPDGRYLVSGSLDQTIKMWELTSYHNSSSRAPETKCIRTFEGHKDYVLSVALTPDGAWVMSGSKDRGVQFWDPATGQAQLMLQGHKNSVISVAPSPRGGLFATGSGDNKARIWRYDAYRG